jgi:hypothetical protein
MTREPPKSQDAALDRRKKALANKQRRYALRQLANGDVSPEALKAHLASVDEVEAEPASNLDPLLTVRSDKGGTRRRTIFCRILSDIFHSTFGRWHDVEVAALCEIAFDRKDVTTAGDWTLRPRAGDLGNTPQRKHCRGLSPREQGAGWQP